MMMMMLYNANEYAGVEIKHNSAYCQWQNCSAETSFVGLGLLFIRLITEVRSTFFLCSPNVI